MRAPNTHMRTPTSASTAAQQSVDLQAPICVTCLQSQAAGPLFPLNSLMLHGLIYARQAEHLGSDPEDDFTNEVHSYFGSGTQLQELYISHALLSKKNWDTIAEAANWSRSNAEVLRDTHWVGGDPGKLEVYGWAAWSPASRSASARRWSPPMSILA